MKSIDVVSNTSPLIFLEKIQILDLLQYCFKNIIIPETVLKEWGTMNMPGFIQLKPISELGKSYINGAVGRLHRGELEVIRLAKELKCKIVLIDDLLARNFAERQGLTPIGILGILKILYNLELLSLNELKKKVGELIDEYNLFISPNVLDQYWNSF